MDTSALVAIIEDEPGAGSFHGVIRDGGEIVIGSPNLLELKMVALSRKPDHGLREVDATLEIYDIEVRPWGLREANIAIDAFARFGRGRHPAALNFGDCMAYALAKSLGAPLLFKRSGFALTDIAPAFTGPLADGV